MINRHSIQKIINKTGFDIRTYPTRLLRNRLKLIHNRNIDVILDVGANVGQYATEMRGIGYKQRIISFEPINSVFEVIKEKSETDSNWEVKRFALGDFDGATEINISNNSPSSSLIEMMPQHIEAAPFAKYIGKETISVKKLDTIFSNLDLSEKSLFMKLDVQGFEKQVLEGAKKSLPFIKGIQIELSLVPLYKGEGLYLEMINYLDDLGYSLFSIEPGFINAETGQLLQFDGIFFKK